MCCCQTVFPSASLQNGFITHFVVQLSSKLFYETIILRKKCYLCISTFACEILYFPVDIISFISINKNSQKRHKDSEICLKCLLKCHYVPFITQVCLVIIFFFFFGLILTRIWEESIFIQLKKINIPMMSVCFVVILSLQSLIRAKFNPRSCQF